MSIRVISSGHSFAFDAMTQIAPKDIESFSILTHKSTLIPEEIFDKKCAEHYLAVCGLAPSVGESVVCSASMGGVVAVMAIDSKAKEQIKAYIGKKPNYTTPLLDFQPTQQSVVNMFTAERYLYINVWQSGTMRHSEVLICDSDADLLCVLSGLTREFSLSGFKISIKGDDTARVKSLLKKYFKGEICE